MPQTGTLRGNKKLGVRLWMMDGWEIKEGLAGWSAMEDAREEASVLALCVVDDPMNLAGQWELRRLGRWKTKATGAGNVESVGRRNAGGWWNAEEDPENHHTLERWGNPVELRRNEQLRSNKEHNKSNSEGWKTSQRARRARVTGVVNREWLTTNSIYPPAGWLSLHRWICIMVSWNLKGTPKRNQPYKNNNPHSWKKFISDRK